MTKTDAVNMEFDEQLKDLSTNELIEIQKSIKRIIEEREVSEDVIKRAIEYLDSITRGSVRYTDLTLSGKAGFKTRVYIQKNC